ncbi:hypothetical protein CFC21_071220 [Triticum aestivum]|uniref:DUF641 domain-containing protein n=2 Tax=Triticum aestivum TaxID=4565 RepID=A0A9R1HFJ7_WHEAT|nr:hypothetical protein CFC21_071220 [Triticum aestivum]
MSRIKVLAQLGQVMALCIMRGVQPLQYRGHPMWDFNGEDDATHCGRKGPDSTAALAKILSDLYKGEGEEFLRVNPQGGFSMYNPPSWELRKAVKEISGPPPQPEDPERSLDPASKEDPDISVELIDRVFYQLSSNEALVAITADYPGLLPASQGRPLGRHVEPAATSHQGAPRPGRLKRNAVRTKTPGQRKKNARRTISGEVTNHASTSRAPRPDTEAEGNTRLTPDAPPIEDADKISTANSKVESAMNHKHRRAVLRDACFSQEAFDAFNSGDAYLRAAQNGLARATNQYVKDIRVLTEKNAQLYHELEECRAQLQAVLAAEEESKKTPSDDAGGNPEEQHLLRRLKAGESVLTRVRQEKNNLQDANTQLSVELKDVRAQLSDSVKENQRLRRGIFSMLIGRPAEEMPGYVGDLLPELSQLHERARQVMQGIAQALWPSVFVPEGLGELAEKLKRARQRFRLWKILACRQGAREAWAMVKTRYTKADPNHMAEVGPVGPDGKEIPVSLVYGQVELAAKYSQQDCRLDGLLDSIEEEFSQSN